VNGILIVDKPAGMTSHDAVARVRKALKVKRVGHAGTLDPDATGILVMGIGRGTRLMQFLSGHDKEYVSDVVLGVETTTQDAGGQVVATADASGLTREMLDRTLGTFHGAIDQIPPMVSAVKVGGERLYKIARRGEEVERPPRRVVVTAVVCEEFQPGERARARLRVRCSKGTYVRTLAHDIGRALGTGAHVSTLRRTASGPFTEADAVPLQEVNPDSVRSMEFAVRDFPRHDVDADGARAVAQGKSIPAAGLEGPYAVVGPAGLVAMSQDREGASRPLCVVAEP
jgi:tRNA pseudouridine55 synthase